MYWLQKDHVMEEALLLTDKTMNEEVTRIRGLLVSVQKNVCITYFILFFTFELFTLKWRTCDFYMKSWFRIYLNDIHCINICCFLVWTLTKQYLNCTEVIMFYNKFNKFLSQHA